MNINLLFSIASFAPGIVWICLFFLPAHPKAKLLADALIVILTVLYSISLIPHIREAIPIIANPTLENIQLMLSTKSAVAITWTQMVIGDLWIGKFIALDSVKNGFKFWIRIPVLLTTVFFGPLGLFVYLIVRAVAKKQMQVSLTY